jgi:AcrR family transcriptional regulator
MSIQQRRQREREERHELIVRAARELAEAEGWEAVTIRRLAERIEYSQPVLYSHFAGKEAIVTAVAVEGFAELAQALRDARIGAGAAGGPGGTGNSDGVVLAWAALARAYVQFADANPALYQAMFTLATDLPFARPEAPEPLKAAFDQIYQAILPMAGGLDPGTLTEVAWAALHGLVTLNQAGRFQPGQQDHRLALLIDLFLASYDYSLPAPS